MSLSSQAEGFAAKLHTNVNVLVHLKEAELEALFNEHVIPPLQRGMIRKERASLSVNGLTQNSRGLKHVYSRFWKAIVNHSIIKENAVWTLPNGKWLRFDPSHLYVRQSYVALFGQLQTYIQTPVNMDRRALILGAPGVGKSAFLNYVIHELFARNPQVTLRFLSQSEDLVFLPNGTIKVYITRPSIMNNVTLSSLTLANLPWNRRERC